MCWNNIEMITQIKKQMITQIRKNKFAQIKGQSLSELAIFASIFLFSLSMLIQYGLTLNYQQGERMFAYRRALGLAYQGFDLARPGSYARLKDRAIPDAQDELAVSEHYPSGAGATVTWTNALGGHLVPGCDEDEVCEQNNPDFVPDQGALPASVVEINGKPISGHQDSNDGVLLQASFQKRSFNAGDTIRIKKTCSLPYLDCGGLSYRWVVQRLIEEEYQACFGEGIDERCDWYAKDDGNDDTYNDLDSLYNIFADVDADGREERIFAIGWTGWTYSGPDENGDGEKDNRSRYINKIAYVDYQEGEIDWSDPNEGFKPGYVKTFTSDASIAKLENTQDYLDSIVTQESIEARETIEHDFWTQSKQAGHRVYISEGGPGGQAQDFDKTTTRDEQWETTND